MLHLSLVSSDTVCASHTAGGHATGAAMAGMPMPTATTPKAANAATPDRNGQDHQRHPCETPVRPNCCEALASCNSTFAASGSSSGQLAGRQARISNSVIEVPASELAAPDTPPPKA